MLILAVQLSPYRWEARAGIGQFPNDETNRVSIVLGGQKLNEETARFFFDETKLEYDSTSQ